MLIILAVVLHGHKLIESTGQVSQASPYPPALLGPQSDDRMRLGWLDGA